MEKVSFIANTAKKRSRTVYKIVVRDIKKRPFMNVLLGLGVVLLLLLLSHVFPKTVTKADEQKVTVKTVRTYIISGVPKLSVQAQTEKSGVLTISAMTGGVVQKIYYREGQEVGRGDMLISLSSNYQGGNSFATQRELAETQYAGTVNNYDLQKSLIASQRDIATASAENAAQLRDITEKSLGDTRKLVELNEQMLKNVETTLQTLSSTQNPDQAALAAAKQQQVQLVAALSQARNGVRSAEYQSQSDKPPAQLATFQRDVTFKQLQLQENMLDTAKQAAGLQVQLARVAEGLMYPASPFAGVVQRVFVKEGQLVNPGTPLAVVSQYAVDDPITAIAYVSPDVAKQISLSEMSTLHIRNKTYQTYPSFVSTDVVANGQYAVYYNIPDTYASDIVEQGYIPVDIPVGTNLTGTFLPLDSVYQTTSDASVFINENGKAKNKKVVLGDVYGSFVEVISGITNGDKVITSRNIIEGDSVTEKK